MRIFFLVTLMTGLISCFSFQSVDCSGGGGGGTPAPYDPHGQYGGGGGGGTPAPPPPRYRVPGGIGGQ